MPISDKDREIWRMAMRDVKPLSCEQLPQTTLITSMPKKPVTVRHTWDLHGMTLSQAHQFTLRQVNEQKNSHKWMMFITGKSGQMNQEFKHWLARNPHVTKVDITNDGGAYKVWFKKTRQKQK